MAMYKIIGGDKREYGPISGDELRRWLAEGRLNSQSVAQAEGSNEWKPLTSFPEFVEALRTQTGQPPLMGAPPPLVNPAAWSAEILAREPQVRIGECLSLSWKLLSNNFGLLAGAAALLWLIGLCQFVPLIGSIGYWILRGVFYGGFCLLVLKRIRGQTAQVGDIFAGFKLAFGQLALVGAISSLLEKIGFCFCLLPWLYLTVAWAFGLPLAADKRLEFWSALELSRKTVTRVWFEMLGLMVLAFLPLILAEGFAGVKMSISAYQTVLPAVQELAAAGPTGIDRLIQVIKESSKDEFLLDLLTHTVGMLGLPFAAGALMYAYENLFGTRTAPAA